MLYIKNTGRYAIAFTIVKNNREVKIELDRRRLYMDTGNIATTGITAVEEADVEEMKKQKRFNAMLESGELELLKEEEVRSPEENKVKELEQKNLELQKKLEEAEKKTDKKIKDENKVLKDENATLKAKLEALSQTAQQADNEVPADNSQGDTEGF